MNKSAIFVAVMGVVVLGAGLGSQVALAGKSARTEAKKNIVQVAREAGSFTTLGKALEAADLVGTLSGKGSFTVFAPTDAAFAKLPAGTVESLLKDPVKLKQILLYHVVAGEVRAAKVVASKSLATVNGQSLEVSTEGGPKVNDANIVTTDVMARNGVIHVIDTVLLPR